MLQVGAAANLFDDSHPFAPTLLADLGGGWSGQPLPLPPPKNSLLELTLDFMHCISESITTKSPSQPMLRAAVRRRLWKNAGGCGGGRGGGWGDYGSSTVRDFGALR